MGKTKNKKMDLHGFLEDHEGEYLRIKKPVKLFQFLFGTAKRMPLKMKKTAISRNS